MFKERHRKRAVWRSPAVLRAFPRLLLRSDIPSVAADADAHWRSQPHLRVCGPAETRELFARAFGGVDVLSERESRCREAHKPLFAVAAERVPLDVLDQQ